MRGRHHEGRRKEEIVKEDFGVDSKLNDVSGEHVYVLTLEDEDGSTWYYVGASSSVFNRIVTHVRNPPRAYWMDTDLQVTGVESIEHVTEDDSHAVSKEARRIEHQKFTEIVRREDTKRVLGGK